MYPHERSLVKRLENKPFVLLGINSDPDKAKLKEVLNKEQITWRSWWDGGDTSGPIARKWNVQGWPTVYVLDAKGIIRYRDVHGKELDTAVDALVKEIETRRAKGEAARLVYEAMVKELHEGRGQVNADRLYLWSRRWMEAQRDVSPKKADQVAALEAHRDRMKDLRKTTEQRYKAGQGSHAEVLSVDFYIAEAELWLTEATKAK